MKRTIACTLLSAGMIAMPIAANAHGYHGHGYHGRGGGHGEFHGGGHGDGLIHALALPLIAGAAVLGAVATIATAPFYDAPPAPAYYGPPPGYAYAPAPAPYGYGPPPVYQPAYGYAPPAAYGYAPQVCTYYPNGARYCR